MTMTKLCRQSAKPWKPHKYQTKAVKFLLEHACAALFLDPGLGKTSITLAAIKYLKSRGIINKVLVVAPLRVCHEVWPVEVEEWKDFNGLNITVLHGPTKDKDLYRSNKTDVFVINPEGLDWLLDTVKTKNSRGKVMAHVNVNKFKKLGFDTLVIDELSKFKHPGTGRFKALKHVLPTFQRRWGLTGTPMPNGLLDLFGQVFVLDLGNALGRYITHYRSEYFEQKDFMGYVWEPREGAEQEIYEALHPLALRMSAEDYLDMPKLINNNIFVELPKKAYKVYDQVEQDLFSRVQDRTIVAANAAAASTKCRQVANGAVYLDAEIKALVKAQSFREYAELHTEKTKALLDLISELQGAQLLVAYEFEHDLDRLQEALGYDVPFIGGGVNRKETSRIIKAWNSSKIPVLLAHPKAAGHGLNLQTGGCHHVCWYSIPWDYELYDQLIRRVYRQGNKSDRVFIYHILSRGTIDETIMLALHGKERSQKALFTALKELRAKRLKGG